MGLFGALNKSESPKTATELANIINGDKLLIGTSWIWPYRYGIRRLILSSPHSEATGCLAHSDRDKSRDLHRRACLQSSSHPGPFRRLQISVSFVIMHFAVQELRLPCRHDETALCCVKMHEFLAQTEYKNPKGPIGLFQHAHNTQMQFFPWMMQYPAKLTSFLTMLEGWRVGRAEWFEIYPAEKLLFEGAKAETETSALFVDVAGGHGYDIQNFKDRFPNQTGRLVLQDQPSVIDGIKELHPDIVRMNYDFFTEQPIKGERGRIWNFC